jgi:hypothetical protein
VKHLQAVLEGGRESCPEEEAAGVELGEVDDEGHRGLALPGGQTRDLGDELGVGELRGAGYLHEK